MSMPRTALITTAPVIICVPPAPIRPTPLPPVFPCGVTITGRLAFVVSLGEFGGSLLSGCSPDPYRPPEAVSALFFAFASLGMVLRGADYKNTLADT